jgi:invasion protein IalB
MSASRKAGSRARVLAFAASVALFGAVRAAAQEPAAASPDAGAEPGSVGWATRCVSKTRAEPLECVAEQSVVKADTRQLIAMFSVRIPSDTRSPVTMIQLPLGLYLPAALEVLVDDGAAVTLPLQTCDANGCYAGAPLSPELLDRLRRGRTLRLRFENLARAKMDVALSLEGFSQAFDAVK